LEFDNRYNTINDDKYNENDGTFDADGSRAAAGWSVFVGIMVAVPHFILLISRTCLFHLTKKIYIHFLMVSSYIAIYFSMYN